MRASQLRITEDSLNLRKSLIGLGPGDIRALAKARPWAHRVAPSLVREFYDLQFAHAGVLDYLERTVLTRGGTLQAMRARLEAEQTAYFLRIFDEAADGGGFGAPYFAERLRIGRFHNQINLPVKWYLGSNASYVWLMRRYLAKTLFWRPWLCHRVETAFNKVLNYDMQAVMDAFMNGLLDDLGFDSARVDLPSPLHDVSDGYGQFKQIIGQAMGEMRKTQGELNKLSGAIRETTAAVKEGADEQAVAVAEGAATVSYLMEMVTRMAMQAEQASAIAASRTSLDSAADLRLDDVMIEFRETSSKISAITKVIDDLAMQTNLLAINASIEAARAGDQGRGFGVIAVAIRDLSIRSVDASRDIRALALNTSGNIERGSAATRKLADFIQSFHESSAAQAQAITEFDRSMHQIRDVAVSNSDSVRSLAERSRNLAAKVATIESLFSWFKPSQ